MVKKPTYANAPSYWKASVHFLLQMCRYVQSIESLIYIVNCLAVKLLKQCCRYHKLSNPVFQFYRRHSELIGRYLFENSAIGHTMVSIYDDLV